MIKVASCRDNETPTKRRKFQLNVKAKQILTLLRESWTKNVSPARLCVARLQKEWGYRKENTELNTALQLKISQVCVARSTKIRNF